MCMLYYITQVLHYLISFLAIRKCFVYFFPSTERTIFPILGRFYKRVWILCLFFASKDVMFGISYLIFSCHENCSIYCDILKNSYVVCLFAKDKLLWKPWFSGFINFSKHSSFGTFIYSNYVERSKIFPFAGGQGEYARKIYSLANHISFYHENGEHHTYNSCSKFGNEIIKKYSTNKNQLSFHI